MTGFITTSRDLKSGATLGCDVAIVGSGAGGAAAAAELAEAGLDVIVIEEGPHYKTEDFTSNSSEMIRALYRDGAATMALGAPPVLYQEGRAVGGSTVINGGMSFRTPESVLTEWTREHKCHWATPEKMDFYFDRVERRTHVRHQDKDSIGRDNQLLKAGADKLGWEVIPNTRNQVHCSGTNNCAWGCPTGAKQSALVSYIPRAVHFGARVYSDLRADRVWLKGCRAVGVLATVTNPDGSSGAKVRIAAKHVIIACGSIHTPALLHRSGIKSPSGAIGHNLLLHPNVKVVAVFDEDVRGWEGVHQGFQVREFRNRGVMTLAAVNVPPSILGMTLRMYGDALGKVMHDYSKMLVAGMLLEDSTSGRVRVTPGGRPVPTYTLADQDFENALYGTQKLCELLFEVGAKSIHLPFGDLHSIDSPDQLPLLTTSRIRKQSTEVVTVHLMGTCKMGGDRSRAVTDSFGAVYGADRLTVCDASLFPSPVGVNPMLTIQALATRNAHYLIENHGSQLS